MATALIGQMLTTPTAQHNDLREKVNQYLQTKAQDPDSVLNPTLTEPSTETQTPSIDDLLHTLQESIDQAKGIQTP